MRRNIWISNEAEEVLEQALDGKPLSKFISEAVLKASNNTQHSDSLPPKVRKRRDVCMLRERDFIETTIETISNNMYHLHECGEFRSTKAIASDCNISNEVLVEELKLLLVDIKQTEKIVPSFVYSLKDEEKLGYDPITVFFNKSLTVAMVDETGMNYLSCRGHIPYEYVEEFGEHTYKAYELSEACEKMDAEYDKFDIVQ